MTFTAQPETFMPPMVSTISNRERNQAVMRVRNE